MLSNKPSEIHIVCPMHPKKSYLIRVDTISFDHYIQTHPQCRKGTPHVNHANFEIITEYVIYLSKY